MSDVSLRAASIAAAAAVLLGCGADSGPDGGAAATTDPGQLTIASNPAGTHVYAVAAGLAKLLQEEVGIRTTIRPFSGSSVYLPLLQRGEVALGLNTAIDSYLSYSGLPPYDAPMSNLRALAGVFPLRIMYMVRADSGIESVEDLRGKRVVITFRANAALDQLHTGILATGGLAPGDVTPVTVAGLPEAMRMLTEGRADAVPTGLNTALTLQVNSSVPDGIRYITMGENEARLGEIMPGARVITVTPGDDGVGVTGPTRVSDMVDYLNTGTHMSDDRAYLIVKTLHENWESLRREYSQIRPTAVDGIAPSDNLHPYHDGAIRYYQETGLWTDAHETNQARLLGN